ncbi:MAG: zinc-dependent peptidase [Chromatiales bacterium]|nr:zinc-dependent peptidase [Chromatiales bacterium]
MLRSWRRRRILARHSIPDVLWDSTVAATPAVAWLDAGARRRLRDLALLFLHDKSLEPAGDIVLDDAMRVRIALLACQPILELGLDSYAAFASVIVYPEAFLVRDREHVDEDGVVHRGDEVLTGEAWEQGPVILSWPDVQASGRGEGYNVVAHEFAHKLDMLDGAANGLPPLHEGMDVAAWEADFDSAYDDLATRLGRGEQPWIDPYAVQDPAEFFAVMAELFFDVPASLEAEYPQVYRQLAAFFRQDPTGRAGGPRTSPASP